MELYGKDKGNISLPSRLQPPDFDGTKLKTVIINTQKYLYNLKIAEINKRIQRLEERNQELEDNIKNKDYSIKTVQEEKAQEISGLKSQIASYMSKIKEYKNQLAILEKSRIDDKFDHTAKAINIDKKYEKMRLMLISQLKLLSAKTNVLEDYKSMQHVLEKKLNMQNQFLVHDKEQMAENLRQINRKFRIGREKLKEELYNHLLNLTGVFQLEVAQCMPSFISKLLSENITLSKQLLTIAENTMVKKQDHILHKNAMKYNKKKINNAHMSAKQSIVITKLTKFTNSMLLEKRNKRDINLSARIKPNYLVNEQYIANKDNAEIMARKCETRLKYLEILFYCEKEKLALAENKKRWLSDQLQANTKDTQNCRQKLYGLKKDR